MYSDNNLIGATGILGAANATVNIILAGRYGCGFHLAAGTLAATLTPETSIDNGTTWVATKFIDVTGTQSSSLILTNPNSATEIGISVMGGVQQVRVRVSAYTSGTAQGFIVATAAASMLPGSGGGGGGGAVTGTLTNNNAAPSNNNLGVLPAIANAAAPTYTEGDQVLLSTDLAGNLRTSGGGGGGGVVTGNKTNNAAAPGTNNIGALVGIANAAAPTYTEGDMVLSSLDLSGNTRTIVTNSPAVTVTSGTVTANIGTSGSLALDATVAKLNSAQGSTTSGETGPLVQGAVTTAAPTYTTAQTSPLSLTTAGALRTDASASTQPVSGTVTANIGTAGTLALDATVAKLNSAQGSTTSGETGPLIQGAVTTAAPTYTTAQTSPLSLTTAGALRTDASGSTQPVSGTVTANIGTSGSLALDASVTGLQIAQGSTTSGQKGDLVLGAVTTAAPTYTTAQSSPLSLTTAGALRTDASGTTQPVSGTVTANIGTSGSLALNASVTGLQVAQGSTTSGQSGGLTLGAVTTAAPTYTTAQTSPLSLTTGGALRVDASAATITVTGTVTANSGTGTRTVAGNLTNNNAAPAATQVGVIPALANAADPTDTEGDQVLVSVDLAGYLRVRNIRAPTGTVTSTAAATSSTAILASNTARKGATIINSSTSIAYINMGATASSSAYTVAMNAAGAVPSYYEVPFGYTGAINAIWVAANGNAIVTEFT